jgi:hypothetical protein
VWANGTPFNFSGQRTVAGQAEFINEHCGTERGADGLLSNAAGLITAASDIAQALIASADPAPYVAQLKAIAGADSYVKATERFVLNGTDQIAKDMATMAKILASRQSSWSVLDNIKRRYNIFGEFRPRPATPPPTPKPTPEPTSEPVAIVDEPDDAPPDDKSPNEAPPDDGPSNESPPSGDTPDESL